ncbi:hypothetical protein RFI_26679 [Reticulomyxa filosa]|uniref:Uncharacterized protein n=1 Tax=Reticulomyxa filosa TaxID=46433 RepID=X6M9L6_RETFI|nr:hypothetical protein RFI_26679 [Reticulomyxa filosa]|eukprot:ETO10698.1 hypothetical protein RFI_26679 [Reticulomyxa filosa]
MYIVLVVKGCVLMWGFEPVTDMVHTTPKIFEYMRPYRIYQICGAKDFTVALGVHAKEPVNKPNIISSADPLQKKTHQTMVGDISQVVGVAEHVGGLGFQVKQVLGNYVQVEKTVDTEEGPPPPPPSSFQTGSSTNRPPQQFQSQNNFASSKKPPSKPQKNEEEEDKDSDSDDEYYRKKQEKYGSGPPPAPQSKSPVQSAQSKSPVQNAQSKSPVQNTQSKSPVQSARPLQAARPLGGQQNGSSGPPPVPQPGQSVAYLLVASFFILQYAIF